MAHRGSVWIGNVDVVVVGGRRSLDGSRGEIVVVVVVEGGPRRLLLGRSAEQGEHLVALDGEFGDGLLEAHRTLQHLADRRHRQRYRGGRKFAGLLDDRDGQTERDTSGERRSNHGPHLASSWAVWVADVRKGPRKSSTRILVSCLLQSP